MSSTTLSMDDFSATPTAAEALPATAAALKKAPKPSHPRISHMVINAINALQTRGGSSLQAIKKYIAANNSVESEKVNPFIRRYLKYAVASGSLVQTSGKGASGSFKLPKNTPNTVKSAAQKSRTASAAKRSSYMKPVFKKTLGKAKNVAFAAKTKKPSKTTKKAPATQESESD